MARKRWRPEPVQKKDKFRTNRQIRKSPVRLIDDEGTQLGVVPIEEARARAEEIGLDLVEVGPDADPPVVRILDWGKLKYEQEKKARESRKKQHTIDVKEVKYRPNIDDHDFEIKTQRARKFLSSGKKVKFTVFFRYRQLRRPELGDEVLNRVVEELADIAAVESRSGMDGRRLVMVLAPVASSGR
ncbi:MAG: translation initiation factor IF-3 [Acidobacteriota bacterium]|nr:translation initiation factor IF-3 [Acidobacteriota bacterium]MDH3522364.1 translation initiation factor IF-3 [Acidobacteriota bacterium]